MLASVGSVRCIAAAVLLAGVAAPLSGQGSIPKRNRPLIAMIDSFIAHPYPLNENVTGAIADSAVVRSDVMVTISSSVTPYLCYADSSRVVRVLDGLLLSAFIAGDMREQLAAGRQGDQPEAGMRAMLAVYEAIQRRFADYRVPELDQWREAQAAGQLAGVADSLKQRKGDCAKKPARYPPGVELGTRHP